MCLRGGMIVQGGERRSVQGVESGVQGGVRVVQGESGVQGWVYTGSGE